MSIFTRKKKNPAQGATPAKAAAETSPQKVGVVSSVLPSGSGPEERTPFSDVVAKRFGPSSEPNAKTPSSDAPTVVEPAKTHSTDPQHSSAKGAIARTAQSSRDHLSQENSRSVEPALFTSEEPELETDPMANIGRATTITGNIVAEEDLEIHGTIEGSVQLVEHQVTVGTDGLVKASVEANIVLVHGKITGDVTAADLVEVKPGGIVGGDVKAPRVIMHDGAVIVGSLDMSAALPSSANASTLNSNVERGAERGTGKKSDNETPKKGERPVLKEVGLPPVHATDASDAASDTNAHQG